MCVVGPGFCPVIVSEQPIGAPNTPLRVGERSHRPNSEALPHTCGKASHKGEGRRGGQPDALLAFFILRVSTLSIPTEKDLTVDGLLFPTEKPYG